MPLPPRYRYFGGPGLAHAPYAALSTGCAPAPQGRPSSLITSAVYASSVRSSANGKLALAVSHTNVVLTISVPSSLFPPSP